MKTLLPFLLFSGLILMNSCSVNEPSPFNSGNNNNSNTNGTNPQNGNPTTPPQPVAKFTVNKRECILPCQVNFTNQSTNATSYIWEFGESGVNQQAYNQQYNKTNPVWTYTTWGEKNVQLEAKSAYGQYKSGLFSINIYQPMTRGEGIYLAAGKGGSIKVKSKGYDLEVTGSKDSRIPTGIYKRCSPEESSMEIYYAYSGDNNKRFYDRARDGIKGDGLEWRDTKGTETYTRCNSFSCNW
jgi:PKD repeat protein